MSQSPVEDIVTANKDSYRQGWAALVRLLHLDSSFSGRERHCAFLNLGGERFADISAVTGFDYPDDGRTVVASDWDFDGDLDLWLTSRIAPRLRLLRNDLAKGGESVSLKLHGNGKTTNLDAIGARCEIRLKGDPLPLLRSVRAGDSFISQSGARLHFGLGEGAEIESVLVRWPGGAEENFTGVSGGGCFDLKQGAGAATPWTPPSGRKSLVAADQVPEAEPESARIVLPSRLLLPTITKADGDEIPPADLRGPLLINIWASWCAPCVTELSGWTEQAGSLREAGLRVLALNTDSLGGEGDPAKAKSLLDKIGFPFETEEISGDSVLVLDLFQRAFLDRWLPLPVPSSFLVDRDGRVAAIYKGPVGVDRLVEDLELLDAVPEALRAAATPFVGRWAAPPPKIGPGSFVSHLVDHKHLDVAGRYLDRFVAMERASGSAAPAVLAGALRSLALLAMQSGDFSKAAKALEEAIAQVPSDPELAKMLAEAKRGAMKVTAKSLLEERRRAVEENPTDGQAHMGLADSLRDTGDFRGAIKSYKTALSNDPKLLAAAGKLSWTLAVHPDPEIRQPEEALALAERLNSMSEGKDPFVLDLLGIAQAANGDFDAAAASARAAIPLFQEGTPIQKAAQARIGLYEGGKPFIETAWGK